MRKIATLFDVEYFEPIELALQSVANGGSRQKPPFGGGLWIGRPWVDCCGRGAARSKGSYCL